MLKLALVLAGCLLTGCAHSTNHDPSIAEGTAGKQLPVRVIIYFSQASPADGKQLAAVISEACHCSPIFIRPYSSNALIYEIGLPQNHPFALFEKALLAGGVSLGVQAIEQDILMQHQQ